MKKIQNISTIYLIDLVFGGNLQISFIKVFLKSFFKFKKMFTQYTNQLLSIILCSTFYEKLLLNTTTIYVAKKDEIFLWNLTKK
jgi:hypothetical protein